MVYNIDTIISIHAPREGSDPLFRRVNRLGFISIHAPREGSDYYAELLKSAIAISIHAPREGSDRPLDAYISHHHDFNPRSP